ncbi:helix-turn-helix domain-containing protein [Clostridium gasigenes]|uniref:Helix-turn-helix domain-containing protein n=1 Tax=Clostridium gasigenes TaxID=94869 RepID=A0A1H0M5H7_9CLOT|nr:helix-turn-helix transcriptional regulator [Clostridium gasigenes]SDO75476.1 Helix-turn-helix domain-containing protein [Clostridium gasigenes]
MKTIADRIKEALGIRGMKQSDLVEKTGIGKSSISTYLSGAYEPKQRNIYKIAKALNVNEPWLMGLDVQMEKSTEQISIDTSLCIKEIRLINVFKQLNDTGKDEAIKRVSELTEIIKYTQDEICASKMIAEEPAPYLFDAPITVAAHDDTLTHDEKTLMDERIIEALKKL